VFRVWQCEAATFVQIDSIDRGPISLNVILFVFVLSTFGRLDRDSDRRLESEKATTNSSTQKSRKSGK
jgi:hypothetical protein